MDWIITALLVTVTQIQLIGWAVASALGAPEDAMVLFQLGNLLMDEAAFADFPEAVPFAIDKIKTLLGV